MIFENAIYLWGLLGLLLPIAIHLWSRKKVKTIKVGSTKLLQASEPKQTSSVKLNELLLLFLRLFSILLLVFILAEPSIQKDQENVPINYVIEPELFGDGRMSSILDTVPSETVRVLEKGFPKWADYDFDKARGIPLYWQLAQEMQVIPADSIVVFSRGFKKGLRGKRPTIMANTRWIVIQPNETPQKEVNVIDRDSYAEVFSVSSNSTRLSFKKDSISVDSDLVEINAKKDSIRVLAFGSKDWMVLKKNTPIQIGILENDSIRNQVRFFKAAYRGISQFLNRPITIEILNDTSIIEDYDFDMLISFDDHLNFKREVNLLVYRPDEYTAELITEGPTTNVFYLNELLDSENIVKENLPEKLLKLLGLNDKIEGAINSGDIRTVAENELQPITSKRKVMKNAASIIQITPWLWLSFILILVVERILSKVRKQ